MILQIVIITIFIPITFYYFLLSLGKVDSVMLSETSQRKIPLLVHAVLLVILIQKSITIDEIPELYFFFLASLISTCLALIMAILNFKISLHMMAITALTVFTIGVSLHYHTRLIAVIVTLILSNGMVASSRLEMKAHSRTELVLGSIAGIVPQLAVLYFWL
ncbi:hypothetical protein [Flavobacterium sp. 3HN19-14]|uniref:hypothetical protein n=1 Tax=Flavobacterium sp. 3HN19-14 TaxID=3448133 RepID=UPI003EE17E1F